MFTSKYIVAYQDLIRCAQPTITLYTLFNVSTWFFPLRLVFFFVVIVDSSRGTDVLSPYSTIHLNTPLTLWRLVVVIMGTRLKIT